ncbi:MAG: MaoC family dehydratase [Clostridiales bacterium]|nr:MaoC family dehydratase [Clostridiales bacterium]
MANFNPNDFVVVYPGVYTEKEKALVEKYLADNKAIADRGPVDVQALVNGTLPKGTPGIGPALKVTEAMVRYNSEKYDPENPLLNVAEYAKKLGYENILAFPCFGAHDDTFMTPWPPDARDTLLVSQLNHSVTNYKPVYPGDTLYLVMNQRTITDLTPTEGSIYRNVVLKTTGSVYNQKGEKVNDVKFSVTENLKIYVEGKRPAKMGFAEFWEAPDWMSRRAHYYTDADWEYIKDLWSKEKRQGAEKLYWEDVKIGDEPTWTVDGPILESLAPTAPYGLGCGGSRTIRKEIIAGDKRLVRDPKNGIYKLPNKDEYVPAIPDGAGVRPPMPEMDESDAAINTADIHKQTEERAALINFLGRELACRHIFNWMGDYGWLKNIRWGIMPSEAHIALGKIVPKDPEAEYFLGNVPYMKGKYALAHGLTEDLAIVKSYVYNKYVRDGETLVELAWWIETIEGAIWLEGGATVKLPSKKLK